MRRRRQQLAGGGAALGALSLVAALAGAPAASASAPAGPGAPAHALVAGKTYYAIGVPVCRQPPRPHQAACMAMVRTVVPEGTAGARPFQVAGGATRPDSIGPAGGLTPGDLASAYGLPSTGGGGQTVAVVDAYNDPNINADLQSFDSTYGLATCSEANGCLKVVGQTGTSALPPNDEVGWSLEEALDVETVHSVCQGCKILVVEAGTQALTDLSAAANEATTLHANEVSNSWGYPESEVTPAIEADFRHPGVVITASAGDNGWKNFDFLDPSEDSAQIPAALNTVVSVGGTSLFLNETGGRQSETVWNDNGPQDWFEQAFGESLGAGGGGCSTGQLAQNWQKSVPGWAATGCGTHRLSNDVAAVGDWMTGFDIYDTYTCDNGCITTPGWETLGGTSLSSPLIAATYALAGGGGGIPFPSLTLYGHPKSTYDVTTGGNGWCDGEGSAQCADPNLLGVGDADCAYSAAGAANPVDGECDAQTGYDGPTGLGTPNGLTAFRPTHPTGTVQHATPVHHGASVSYSVTPTDPFPGGRVTSYTFDWGDGSPNTTSATASAAHTYATAGPFTLTVTLTDNYNVHGTATSAVTVS